MTPSPKPPVGDRTAARHRRVLRAGLATLMIVSTLVAVRIGADGGGSDPRAHGNSIEATTSSGMPVKGRNANWSDTDSSQLKKGVKARYHSKKGWTKKGLKIRYRTRAGSGATPKGDLSPKRDLSLSPKGDLSPKDDGQGSTGKPGATPPPSPTSSTTTTSVPSTTPAPSSTTTTSTVPAATSTTTTTTSVPSTTTVAPTTSTTTTTPPTSTTIVPRPVPTPPPSGTQGLAVDLSRLPTQAIGSGSQRIGAATAQPYSSDGVGAFRINCSMSHMNFDDPIVAPGRVGASHLHMFFGNTGVDAYSTSSSIAGSGNSTCTGGTANRSAYWTPAMVDTRTDTPVLPWDDANPWLADNGVQVYYKTGYLGVPSASVQNPPTGLRIVAGSAGRTTQGSSADPATPRYWCNVKGGFSPYDSGYDLNRNCRTGDLLVMSIQFPQCWNGRDLDSPDHQSHMAYGRWGPVFGRDGAGCPATHPVPLPEVTVNVYYEVPASGTSTWRLSSDVYDGPAGYSGHADWWNGWDRDVFQQVVDNCYRPGLDCQMNLLGNGRALN